MDSVLRALGLYVFLVLVFRVLGRKTMAEMTNYDLVLILLIVNVKPVLNGNDFSLTNACIVAVTFAACDVVLTAARRRFPLIEKFVNGVPLILLKDGRPLKEPLKRSRISELDLLEAARRENVPALEKVKWAVLERTGKITIIPMEKT